MKFQFGLVSADSHGQVEKNAFVKRMVSAEWGEFDPPYG